MKAQWQRNDPVHVGDPDALDALLDGLHEAAMAQQRPVAVQLYHHEAGPVLTITVGSEQAAAEWFHLPHGPLVTSQAPADTAPPDGMTVDFGGQPSNLPAGRLLPAEHVRAGARTFLTTGQRPPEIIWRPEGQPGPYGS